MELGALLGLHPCSLGGSDLPLGAQSKHQHGDPTRLQGMLGAVVKKAVGQMMGDR